MRCKTVYAVYETIRSGELTPGYEPVLLYPGDNGTPEHVLEFLYPKYIYKGVFENRNDARRWVDNWSPLREGAKHELHNL